jgi:hypothetical protein
VTQGSTATTTVDTAQQMEDFLAVVKPFRDQGKEITNNLNDDLDKFNEDKSIDTLHELGDELGHGADDLRNLSNQMATITPPPSMAEAWTGYVDYASELASAVDLASKSAKSGSVQGVSDAIGGIDISGGVHFKTVLIQQLTANGIDVPQWVKDIGSSK